MAGPLKGPVPATPDIGYSGADWPDPLAGNATRLQRLWDAWDAMMEARKMGYYRAGGPPPGNLVMMDAINPPATDSGAPYRITPGRMEQIRRGGGYLDAPYSGGGYRRMNPGNVRALRRSMRRVQAFAKLAKKTISFTHHVRMKKHRRK